MLAGALRKHVLLVQNLKLLGFCTDDHQSRKSVAVALTADAFERPNEKLVFRVLHFLLVKLEPTAAMNCRCCWPVVTPQDKTKFKRAILDLVSKLEEQRVLVKGFSETFRKNFDFGPLSVDLLWRLSTQAMKRVITSEFSSYNLRPPPSTDRVTSNEALKTIKAQIAAKTAHFKQHCVARSHAQQQWYSFAAEISSHIKEVEAQQKQLDETRRKRRAAGSHHALPQQQEVQLAEITTISKSLERIEECLNGASYHSSQETLRVLRHHDEDKPELIASKLRVCCPSQHGNKVDLEHVFENAKLCVQDIQGCIENRHLSQLHTGEEAQAKSLLDRSYQHGSLLSTIVEKLQQHLTQVKDINEQLGHDLPIDMEAQTDV